MLLFTGSNPYWKIIIKNKNRLSGQTYPWRTTITIPSFVHAWDMVAAHPTTAPLLIDQSLVQWKKEVSWVPHHPMNCACCLLINHQSTFQTVSIVSIVSSSAQFHCHIPSGINNYILIKPFSSAGRVTSEVAPFIPNCMKRLTTSCYRSGDGQSGIEITEYSFYSLVVL